MPHIFSCIFSSLFLSHPLSPNCCLLTSRLLPASSPHFSLSCSALHSQHFNLFISNLGQDLNTGQIKLSNSPASAQLSDSSWRGLVESPGFGKSDSSAFCSWGTSLVYIMTLCFLQLFAYNNASSLSLKRVVLVKVSWIKINSTWNSIFWSLNWFL